MTEVGLRVFNQGYFFAFANSQIFMQGRRYLFIALGLLTFWRILLLPTLDLCSAEALLVLLSRWPLAVDWHVAGPLTAWLGRVSLMLLGPAEWAVRLWAPLAALHSTLLLWAVLVRLERRALAGWAVVLLNLLPAFNLAAVLATPGMLFFWWATLAAWVWVVGLERSRLGRVYWQLAWGLVLALAPWVANSGWLLSAVGIVFTWLRLKPSDHSVGSWLRYLLPLLGSLLIWLNWQAAHAWPVFSGPSWLPILWPGSNWFRWVLLGSPLLMVVLLGAIWGQRLFWRQTPLRDRAWMLVALGLAGIDFFWFSAQPWPDLGLSVWWLAAVVVVADWCVSAPLRRVEDHISWRTILLVLAALQTVFLLNSDFARKLGWKWSFEQRQPSVASSHWRFLTRDPSSALRGWRTSAQLLSQILQQDPTWLETARRPFLIAQDWRLAVVLDIYLPVGTPAFWPNVLYPRVWPECHPAHSPESFRLGPRYDVRDANGLSVFEGRDALWITDDASLDQPPETVREVFADWRLITVAEIMHGGERVRSLKIFACYSYRPPQL